MVNKNILLEKIGFFFEAMLFFLAGFFLTISIRITIILYIVGIFLAVAVGDLIKKNAIKK